jgi:hypothetical protein
LRNGLAAANSEIGDSLGCSLPGLARCFSKRPKHKLRLPGWVRLSSPVSKKAGAKLEITLNSKVFSFGKNPELNKKTHLGFLTRLFFGR